LQSTFSVLSYFSQNNFIFQNQQQKKWERQKLTELRGKTILILGLGHIGREASRILSCLGAQVLAVDKKNSEELDEMLPLADFVVICLPLTKETHHLFSREKFNRMKPTAVLINVGRGAIVNEKELLSALLQKTIAGAALDVQETEPLPQDSPLWAMENVVITPHHSASSDAYTDRAVEQFCTNLRAYVKGEPLPNLIDKTAGY
jgi:phosphoglycerate dehydrogenase-like enzyme